MKNVLVTGAGGFIGSHLTERLAAEGYKVRAFVRYNSKNSWGWLDASPQLSQVEVVTGDIRDYDSVLDAMQGIDTVFHLAALIGIPYSYVSPTAYIRTNIEGTYNILQSARKVGVENVLVTSTSETYGSAQKVPIDEDHPLVGQSPYSASKIGADQLAISFYRSFELPMKLVRPFNTYGPRQSARAIIPTTISQILNKQSELRLGNVSPTRDLTFVKDTVAGFLAISQSPDLFGEVTNIGMNAEITIGELVKLIASLMQADIEIKVETDRVRPENSEVDRLLCDNSKIRRFSDWQPQYTLESGLIETIEWMRQHQHLYKAEIYNI